MLLFSKSTDMENLKYIKNYAEIEAEEYLKVRKISILNIYYTVHIKRNSCFSSNFYFNFFCWIACQ